MQHPSPLRAALGALMACATSVAPACDTVTTLDDAVPRVTWVAAEPVDASTMALTVWVADVEGDSVDLEVDWVDAAGAATAIAQHVGSYGTIGLTTRDALFDPAGQPHRILWDTTGVAGPVRLRFAPDDRPLDAKVGAGPVVETPSFELATGLPDPVQPAAAP